MEFFCLFSNQILEINITFDYITIQKNIKLSIVLKKNYPSLLEENN